MRPREQGQAQQMPLIAAFAVAEERATRNAINIAEQRRKEDAKARASRTDDERNAILDEWRKVAQKMSLTTFVERFNNNVANRGKLSYNTITKWLARPEEVLHKKKCGAPKMLEDREAEWIRSFCQQRRNNNEATTLAESVVCPSVLLS